jgi:hypothetical protein
MAIESAQQIEQVSPETVRRWTFTLDSDITFAVSDILG